MKLQTVKKRFVSWIVNKYLAGMPCFALKRKLLNSIGYQLGEGTKVVAPIFCSGTLITGKDCWIGRELKIQGNGNVILGDNCDIAPDVTFLTGGHKIGGSVRRAGQGEIYTIHVGNGCWIGARSTIGRNVTIEHGSVVAACACVMKDVGANTLVGGVPARRIRTLHEETTE